MLILVAPPPPLLLNLLLLTRLLVVLDAMVSDPITPYVAICAQVHGVALLSLLLLTRLLAVLDGAQDQLNELEHIKKKEAVLLAVMELETVMRASQM